MKIIQLTDIHIGGLEQDTRGVDTRHNLIAVLDAIVGENADKIVLTGDICFKEPREDVCHWVHACFEERGLTPFIVTGNHDDSEMTARIFNAPLKGNEVYYEEHWEGTRVLFLDTSRAVMSETQWNWFSERMTADGRVLIFAHHPPVFAHVPFMDETHCFKEVDRFAEVIGRHRDSVHLFCGHYHIDKSISRANLSVHITPSTFFQIRDDIQDFGVDHYNVGYRVIELTNEALRHRVNWI